MRRPSHDKRVAAVKDAIAQGHHVLIGTTLRVCYRPTFTPHTPSSFARFVWNYRTGQPTLPPNRYRDFTVTKDDLADAK